MRYIHLPLALQGLSLVSANSFCEHFMRCRSPNGRVTTHKTEDTSLDDFGHKWRSPNDGSQPRPDGSGHLWMHTSGGGWAYPPNGDKPHTGGSGLTWIDLSGLMGGQSPDNQGSHGKYSPGDGGLDILSGKCRIVSSGKDGKSGAHLVCDGDATEKGSGKIPSGDIENWFEVLPPSYWLSSGGSGQCPAGTIPRCVSQSDKPRPDGGKHRPHGDKGREPEKEDNSYKVEDFPCSENKEKPCRGKELKTWQKAVLPWDGEYQQPGPPKPYKFEIEYDFPVILTLVDTETQSEHFLLKMDGEYLGETGGENGYTNQYIGDYNNPEWCLTNGYTRGYFRIPAGMHSRVWGIFELFN